MIGQVESDPYYSLRNTVQEVIERIQSNHKTVLSFGKSGDTSNIKDYDRTRKQLTVDIRAVEKSLTILKKGIAMVRKYRAKYPFIKDGELANRQKFVEQSEITLQKVMDSLAEHDKKKTDDTKLQPPKIVAKSDEQIKVGGTEEQLICENNGFLQEEQLRARRMIDKQDKDIESLIESVDRLHHHAEVIHTEIQIDGKLIDGLGHDVDNAKNELEVVQGALSKLLRTKDSCQIWTILMLALVLILLVALIIWS